MKFAVNQYNVNFHVQTGDSPPIAGAMLEEHPFGIPPLELRQVWIADINDLSHILKTIDHNGTIVDVSKSGYWSGNSLDNPGERLYGLGIYDDVGANPHGGQPVRVVPSGKDSL